MKFGLHCGVLSMAIMLTACSGGGDGASSAGASTPQYPAAQQQFYALNKACQDSYSKGQNEIQKSLAFNECNKQRSTFAAQHGISGWTGTIKDISTDQGADVVTVDIEAEIDGFEMTFMTVNNRFSDMMTNSMITPDNPLFNVLAQMKEGEKVTFDATFLQDPEGKRGVWEGSMTEQGSMSDPAFNVSFSDIRPFGATAAAAVSGEAAAATQAVANAPAVDSSSTSAADENAALREASADYDASVDQGAKPSFDCAKASTQSEQLICSDSALANLDSTLADLYAAARARVSDKAGLKDAQNKWRRDVRDACGDAACMKGAYEERITHLQGL